MNEATTPMFPELPSSAFAPLSLPESEPLRQQPAASYWSDVWRKLRTNRRAFCSLLIILMLLVFTLIGPLLWPLDPAQPNLDLISRGPTLGGQAQVVDLSRPWVVPQVTSWPVAPVSNAQTLAAPVAIALVEPATTQAVRIQWDPVVGAAGYVVYRNDHQPESNQDLGLPLRTLFGGNQVGHEDRLRLRPGTYWYSVVATNGVDESPVYTTLAVDVHPGVRLRDLPQLGRAGQAGDFVKLPAHPLGTDYLGRDLLARLMHGARVSLFIGLTAPLLFVALGALYGGVSGYIGGRTDRVLMAVVDFVIALPFLLFMILFKIAFGIGPGESGILPLLVALVLLSWPGAARLVRGQVLQVREAGYVQAAKLLGGSTLYLVFRHLLPSTFGVLLVALTFAVPSAIFTEAFLSFIGMGVVPPTPSWGSMCNDGMKTMMSHPHELIFPAAMISVTVLAFNLFGDGLRDALDTQLGEPGK